MYEPRRPRQEHIIPSRAHVERFHFDGQEHHVSWLEESLENRTDTHNTREEIVKQAFKTSTALVGRAAIELSGWILIHGKAFFEEMGPIERPVQIQKFGYILSYDPENFMRVIIRGTKYQAIEKLQKIAEIIAFAPTEFLAGLQNRTLQFQRSQKQFKLDFAYILDKVLTKQRGHADRYLIWKLTSVSLDKMGPDQPRKP